MTPDLPNKSQEDLLQAMERFDSELRQTEEWSDWEEDGRRAYAIEHAGKLYPVNKIVAMATGQPVGQVHTDRARPYASNRGLSISELGDKEASSSIRKLFKEVFNKYRETRQRNPKVDSSEPVFTTLKKLQAAVAELPPVKSRTQLRVKRTIGQGNWALVPGIPILDVRETQTPQEGIYCVFLFCEDMSSVYWTLNQGVTQPFTDYSSKRAREKLRARVIEIQQAHPELEEAGFSLDVPIDLRTRSSTGKKYEHATIAYKEYVAENLPSDQELLRDVTRLIETYEEIVEERLRDDEAMKLDRQALEELRETFLERTPGFDGFDPPKGTYAHWERDYKDELRSRYQEEVASVLANADEQDIANPLVKGLRRLLENPLETTGEPQNLLGWRYRRFLRDLNPDQRQRLAGAVAALLKGDVATSARIDRFNKQFAPLLQELKEWSPANSRSFPTLLLMLDDPDREVFIRTSLFRDLTERLTDTKLYTDDEPLSGTEYEQGRQFVESVRSALEDWGWKPRDMIDVQSFLWVAGREEFEPDTKTWIFQYNPELYDARAALREFKRLTWLVQQHADSIQPGDELYIWTSGSDAGIIAKATVIEGPAQMEAPEYEAQFIRSKPEKFQGSKPRVVLELNQTLDERIGRDRLKEHPVLQDLSIIRQPMGTNFPVTEEQANALSRLLEVENGMILKVAPGEEGEYWDECLDEEIICVGWDALGDLGQYESKEALREAFEKEYGAAKNFHNSTISREANNLWRFRNLTAGDVIVANRGMSHILGIGKVTDPGYQWSPNRDYFRHTAHVDWDTSEAGPIPKQGGAWAFTIVELTPEELEEIRQREPPKDGKKGGFRGLLERLAGEGLYFPTELVANYLISLQTKRFVILTGISGTGKTKLASEVARHFASDTADADATNPCIVAVRPDWTDNRGLLGWYNPLTEQYVETPLLQLLFEAADEQAAARADGRKPMPYFLVLDEMNLARVEHYFSDFLSCLESGEPLQLHQQKGMVDPASEASSLQVPRQLRIPDNVFITGTVNVDETTYNFSPKVLDRAFTLELNEVELDRLGEDPEERTLGEDEPLFLDALPEQLPPARLPKAADWSDFEHRHERFANLIMDLNNLLRDEHRHFGYRVANEIARYVNIAVQQASDAEAAAERALDLAILQKVLPKFNGTQDELQYVLRQLLAFSLNGEVVDDPGKIEMGWRLRNGELQREPDEDGAIPPDRPALPDTARKLYRMLRRLRRQGFTAFIE